ncbi:hypothetical protein KKG41_00110 [Patescibacteria group bacterium]|nr:hypothetical protein [Patescibacteria group bacterium]MBU1890561.1 hypothetical protein [Patescibacteria group bacterium]
MNKKTTIIVIIILIIVGVGIAIFHTGRDTDNNTNSTVAMNNNNTTPASNTNEGTTNTASDVQQYDGKIFNISSTDGKVEGLAGIKIAETDGTEYVRVGFFFKINDLFTQTPTNLRASNQYSLLGGHVKTGETRVDDGTGTIGAIYCDKDVMPDVLEIASGNFNDQTMRYIECTYGTTDAWADTDTFYHVYSTAFGASVFTLEDIYELNKLEIYDGSQCWVEEAIEGLESEGLDDDAAVANGPILATYILEYEEE